MAKVKSRIYDPEAQYELNIFDIEYQEGLQARVYQPQGEGPFPAMIDVHGGAWNFGSRLNNEVMDLSMASSGLLVVAVDFRMPPENPFPAQTADVNYAIRWLKKHASDYNGDSRHLGGLGSSSGGQSIMLAAMRPRDPLYRAKRFPEAPRTDASLSWVLSCWGVLDPYARYMYAKEASQRLVDATETYFVTEENMKLGNPPVHPGAGRRDITPPRAHHPRHQRRQRAPLHTHPFRGVLPRLERQHPSGVVRRRTPRLRLQARTRQ